ncbi:MAG: hypothetical protein QOH24_1098 [Verrucomicrobiota bacterium]
MRRMVGALRSQGTAIRRRPDRGYTEPFTRWFLVCRNTLNIRGRLRSLGLGEGLLVFLARSIHALHQVQMRHVHAEHERAD